MLTNPNTLGLFERNIQEICRIVHDAGGNHEAFSSCDLTRRLAGNFPQAFTHVGLVNTACNLTHTVGPAAHRTGG